MIGTNVRLPFSATYPLTSSELPTTIETDERLIDALKASVEPPAAPKRHFGHIMLDIETLGTRPGAHILSIGALAFDPVDGAIDEDGYFYAFIGLPLRRTIAVDCDTLRWWLHQPEAAREQLKADPTTTAYDALIELTLWINRYRHDGTPLSFWAHGSNFDFPLIEAEYASHGLPTPWHYRHIRDVRTLIALANVKTESAIGETTHTPVDDCRAQIRALTKAWYILFGAIMTINEARTAMGLPLWPNAINPVASEASS